MSNNSNSISQIDSKDHDYMFKLVLLGSSGVGIYFYYFQVNQTFCYDLHVINLLIHFRQQSVYNMQQKHYKQKIKRK